MYGGPWSANILSPYLGKSSGDTSWCAEPHSWTILKVSWRDWWFCWEVSRIHRSFTWNTTVVPLIGDPHGPISSSTIYIFLQNIVEIFYHLWLKPAVPWEFTANGFSVPMLNRNSNPMICLYIPRAAKAPQYCLLCILCFPWTPTGMKPILVVYRDIFYPLV